MSKRGSGFLVAFLSLATLAVPGASRAGVFVSITIAPPALPVYQQPLCPGDGYIWTPGYWAYGDVGYYWVPGTWITPPRVGVLWTPGYWGWGGGVYAFHAGYWGPHVGFYGGVNYGFGYVGVGYAGGFWNHGAFNYNRSVNNINVTNVHNVYNKTVINNVSVNRVSYNGGQGGINARPSPEEQAAAREPHQGATPMQSQHEHSASMDRRQFASENHGRPAVTASARPGEFANHGPAAANHAAANHQENRGNAQPRAEANHPAARPAPENHPAAHAEARPAPANKPAGRQEARPEAHSGSRPEGHAEGHEKK